MPSYVIRQNGEYWEVGYWSYAIFCHKTWIKREGGLTKEEAIKIRNKLMGIPIAV